MVLHSGLFAAPSVIDPPSSIGRFAFLVAFAVLCFALIVVRFEYFRAIRGSDADSREPKTNCPSCGARIPADGDRCEYCGEPLTDGRRD